MPDTWDSIAADPEFQAQPPEIKRTVAHNYFKANASNGFQSLPKPKQQEISNSFVVEKLGALSPTPNNDLSDSLTGMVTMPAQQAFQAGKATVGGMVDTASDMAHGLANRMGLNGIEPMMGMPQVNPQPMSTGELIQWEAQDQMNAMPHVTGGGLGEFFGTDVPRTIGATAPIMAAGMGAGALVPELGVAGSWGVPSALAAPEGDRAMAGITGTAMGGASHLIGNIPDAGGRLAGEALRRGAAGLGGAGAAYLGGAPMDEAAKQGLFFAGMQGRNARPDMPVPQPPVDMPTLPGQMPIDASPAMQPFEHPLPVEQAPLAEPVQPVPQFPRPGRIKPIERIEPNGQEVQTGSQKADDTVTAPETGRIDAAPTTGAGRERQGDGQQEDVLSTEELLADSTPERMAENEQQPAVGREPGLIVDTQPPAVDKALPPEGVDFSPEPKHKFSSTQANMPKDVAEEIKGIGKSLIHDNDLAGDGREMEPHVTVKYGIHNDDIEPVSKALEGEGPIKVRMGKISSFPPSESSDGAKVVKIDLDSPDLHRMNKKIAAAVPTTDTHPGYKPHVTLAYVKADAALPKNNPLEGREITLDKITFSDRDGKATEIPLRGGESKSIARNVTRKRAQEIVKEAGGGTVEPDPEFPKKFKVVKGAPSEEKPGVFSKPEHDAAVERLTKKAKGEQLNIGFDPQDIWDAVKIGGHYIEKGFSKFGDWADAMKKTLGNGVTRHLSRIWTATHNYINGQFNIRTPKTVFSAEKPVSEPLLDRLTGAIKSAKPLRGEMEELKHKERQRRAAMMRSTLERSGGEAAIGKLKGAMAGDYPSVAFEPIGHRFSQAERDALFNHIFTHDALKGREFEKARAAMTLKSVLDHGALPTEGEIAMFEKIFGPKLASALLGKRTGMKKFLGAAQEILNIPRTLVSSYDLSATLRQGFQLGTAHPQKAAEAFAAQLKAFGDHDYAVALDNQLRAGKEAATREKAGLEMPSVEGFAAEMSDREEAFMSRLLQRVTHVEGKSTLAKAALAPIKAHVAGIAASERAYITYLNKLRAGVFDSVSEQLEASGMKGDELAVERQKLAKFINAATGRGNVKTSAWANAAFFSPKFMVSRFEAPIRTVAYAAKSGPLGREAARQVVSQAFTWAALYTMAHLGAQAFDWDIDFGVDPRSSDFLKLRIGDKTRVDMGAGYSQPARLIARIISGTTVNSKGREVKTDVPGEVGRFLQYKLSPLPSAAVSAIQGRTPSNEKPTPLNIAKQLTIPVSFQNIGDLVNEHGAAGLGLVLPDMLGAGVNVYQESEKKHKVRGDSDETPAERRIKRLEAKY